MISDITDIKETIKQFIVANYLQGEQPGNLKNDTPLITSSILDSLAAFGLQSFIEKQFGIEFDIYETSVERFNRIDDIASTVWQKISQKK